MHFDKVLEEGLKRGYHIKFLADDIEKKVADKLKEAQQDVELKGFRKGKVPLDILRQKFGSEITRKVMSEEIDGAIAKHFRESGENPAGQPNIQMIDKNWKEGQDFEISLDYELIPDMPDIDFKKITISRLVVKPTNEDIDVALEKIAASAGDFVVKKGAAAAGDRVIMDFDGTIDGKSFEGGNAKDYAMVLGATNPQIDFEEKLIGVKANDKITVDVTFPDNYNIARVAGQKATFKCHIKTVEHKEPAAIDDALATKIGLNDLSELRDRTAKQIENEYRAAAYQVSKRYLFDELDNLVDCSLPTSFLEREANSIAFRLWRDANPGLSEPTEDNKPETTPENLKLAHRRVKMGILLSDVGHKNDINLSEEEKNTILMQRSRRFGDRSKDFLEHIKRHPERANEILAPFFERKVVDFVLELATVTEIDSTREELQEELDKLTTAAE